MRRRVGHLRQPPLPSGQPLSVDFELENEDWHDEDAPQCSVEGVGAVFSEDAGSAYGEEHAGDPGGEEEVDPDGVGVLAAYGFEVEDALEGVGGGDGEEDGKGEEPDDEVDVVADVEEGGGGAGGQGVPEDGLAAEAEGDTETVDGEAEEEWPSFVFRKENVLRVLHSYIHSTGSLFIYLYIII